LAKEGEGASNDYQILIKTKGISEIEKRRAFLFE
jgi:hypothetical protein